MDMKQLKKFVKGAEEAVSPVVATLMLVLVAAGAAVGFSVFMGAFQDDAQENLNSDIKGNCVTIGGSTTVHPVNARMQELYKLAQPNLCVELSQGGSGSGLIGVGTGILDIGARSADIDADDIARWPDFDGDGKKDAGQPELVRTYLGHDAVTFFVDPGNCLAGTAEADLLGYEIIQDLYAGALGLTGYTSKTGIAVDGSATWANVADELAEGLGVATTAADTTATCDLNTSPVVLTDRADIGGTSELACEKLIGTKAGDSAAGTAKATLNADAKLICSEASNKQIPDDSDILADHGNAAVEALILGNENALGYSSVGTGIATGLEPLNYEGVEPTVSNIVAGDFVGSRPLIYVTVGEPQGDVKAWIDFVTNPQRNLEVMDEIGYISIVDALG